MGRERVQLPGLWLTEEEVGVLGDLLQLERAGQGIVPHPAGLTATLDKLQQWTSRVALRVTEPRRHGDRLGGALPDERHAGVLAGGDST